MTNSYGRTRWTDERLDQLASIVANQQEQINLTSEATERTANTVLQLAQIVETVSNKVDRVTQSVDNQIMVIAQQQDSINAELERQGRILDYLMRD